MSGIGKTTQDLSVSRALSVSQADKAQDRQTGEKNVTELLTGAKNTPVQKNPNSRISYSNKVTFGNRACFGSVSASKNTASGSTKYPAESTSGRTYANFKEAAKKEESVKIDAKGNVTISGAKGLRIGRTIVSNIPPATKKP
ncbi:hypothetical protein [Erwinia pyrifoliae]|uniref:Filamentous hemagglutinin n=1 Tax=Erwinia pyrifoliae TaxID=79967 RepID=A0ABY5X890_ERWPY|nr:hypothetical protein [Erwinia pyrifoliae]AUX71067.1 hypothetical protein CPI84_00075 [Erwinia pyrifoliae]MCT2385455.1 hypothetical protein [Erwinia pyrifoliae]MCU8588972.1 hypothetical protein [Erwinia pyrifoliae]UWS29315.1 hypothetical protein NYP81_15665 [Erwinia pyrifoliae]UWS33616.1 hypothetical protein NYP84_19030 [Erwinia pyrifoliae]